MGFFMREQTIKRFAVPAQTGFHGYLLTCGFRRVMPHDRYGEYIKNRYDQMMDGYADQ
jgi:hypothetical protein